ncbi:MAG: hypothetical protein R6V46_04205 [Desulfatiglandaceae bacterium]
MKTTVGLWVDRRKAVVIVTVTDQGEEVEMIISGVEKQRGRCAGRRSKASYEPRQVPTNDSRQEKSTGYLSIKRATISFVAEGGAKWLEEIFVPGDRPPL